jgi:membrane-associated phospholipid phosphatase
VSGSDGRHRADAAVETPVASARRPAPARRAQHLIDRRQALVGASVCAVVVIVLGLLATRPWAPLVDLDRWVDDALHPWALDHRWAVDVSLWLKTAGEVRTCTVVVLLTTVVLLVRRRWWVALTVVLLSTLAPLITDRLKDVFARPRPNWQVALSVEPTYSYPSGHATAGIAVYAACGVALGSLLRDESLGALVAFVGIAFGIAISLSRLVLGVHWPSDVVGGWCVALAVAGVLASLFVLPPPRGERAPR